MALTSPVEFSQIVDSYIDAWRVHGFLPECRANHLRGWTQGGTLNFPTIPYSELSDTLQARAVTLLSAILP